VAKAVRDFWARSRWAAATASSRVRYVPTRTRKRGWPSWALTLTTEASSPAAARCWRVSSAWCRFLNAPTCTVQPFGAAGAAATGAFVAGGSAGALAAGGSEGAAGAGVLGGAGGAAGRGSGADTLTVTGFDGSLRGAPVAPSGSVRV